MLLSFPKNNDKGPKKTAKYIPPFMTEVSEILGRPDFENPHTPLTSNTFALRTEDLRELYSFLTSGLLQYSPAERPECPVTNKNQQTLARFPYKDSMVKYLKGFGCDLQEHPCNYTPAFLEALANFLEHRAKKMNEVDQCSQERKSA